MFDPNSPNSHTGTMERFHIRRLWPLDFAAFKRHLLRLDQETRISRFGTAVNNGFLEHYADEANRLGNVIYGAFADGEIHASAELRPISQQDHLSAEAAFTVEHDVQDAGLGSALMDRILTAAQNRGIGELYMICLRDNGRMQHLAEKFGARLRVEDGEVTGTLQTPYPTPLSVIDEGWNTAQGFITAAFDWRG